MASSKMRIPMEAYKKLHEAQLAKLIAAQYSTIASKVLDRSQHGKPGPIKNRVAQPFNHPATWGVPRHHVFFVGSAPYTNGNPNPENASHTRGNAVGAYFNVEGFGDSDTGHFSVGVSAGNWRNVDWTGEAVHSELPDRWNWGDAINSSASIVQAIELPSGINAGSNISANVEFSWDPQYPGSYPLTTDGSWEWGLLYDAIYLTPGLSNSALNGFVGATVAASVTVSLISENGPIAVSQTIQNILNVGANAQFYGTGIQDASPAPFLFLDFAFAGNPWAVVNLLASVPYAEGATQLLVETTVSLSGHRGGVNDPNAGSVAAAFQNLYKPAKPVSFIPSRPNPFILNRVTAFSSSF